MGELELYKNECKLGISYIIRLQNIPSRANLELILLINLIEIEKNDLFGYNGLGAHTIWALSKQLWFFI